MIDYTQLPEATFGNVKLKALHNIYAYDKRAKAFAPKGVHTATLSDWLIKVMAVGFYLCKPSILAQTYEPVNEGGNA